MKALPSLLTAALWLGASSLAWADGPPVSLQLNVGTTPVYLPPAYPPMDVPPVMVWLPQLQLYAALGARQPIFYLGRSYYYHYGNRWYAGPGYRGPWHPLAAPPPPLRGYREHDWERYQERAREYYRQPDWRHFRAGERPPGLRDDGPRGHGPERPGHGPGGEHGPGGRHEPGDHGHGGPG